MGWRKGPNRAMANTNLWLAPLWQVETTHTDPGSGLPFEKHPCGYHSRGGRCVTDTAYSRFDDGPFGV
jgi:hypothetical protein